MVKYKYYGTWNGKKIPKILTKNVAANLDYYTNLNKAWRVPATYTANEARMLIKTNHPDAIMVKGTKEKQKRMVKGSAKDKIYEKMKNNPIVHTLGGLIYDLDISESSARRALRELVNEDKILKFRDTAFGFIRTDYIISTPETRKWVLSNLQSGRFR